MKLNFKRSKTLLITLVAGLVLMGLKHPFYLSVTDLKYNEREATLQGSVKIFVNDLEDALTKINKKPVDLIHPKDAAATNKMLFGYLETHLEISLNSKKYEYYFIGFEREQEAVWLYIEIKKCPLPKKVEIKNSILYDFLKEQSNIVHMEVRGEKKSSKVNCPEKVMSFGF